MWYGSVKSTTYLSFYAPSETFETPHHKQHSHKQQVRQDKFLLIMSLMAAPSLCCVAPVAAVSAVVARVFTMFTLYPEGVMTFYPPHYQQTFRTVMRLLSA